MLTLVAYLVLLFVFFWVAALVMGFVGWLLTGLTRTPGQEDSARR
jgi:hypothetical protein